MTTSNPGTASFQPTLNPAAATLRSDQVKAALQSLFPASDVDDDLAQRVLQEMQAPGTSAHALAMAAAAPNLAPFAGPPVTYYRADAQHARLRGTGSVFLGQLPLVRCSLPATGDFGANLVPTIPTQLGELLPGDRKIASVQMLSQFTDQTAERIDLLTPVRTTVLPARFGAVALYLCYARAGDEGPSFYVLEAGTATGQARVLFFSQGMDPIVNWQTAYEPTPFSKTTNYYTGTLTMHRADPGEPDTLVITSTDTSGQGPDAGQTPYIRITLTYNRLPGPQGYDPVELIIQAAARVGLIGRAIGVDPGVAEEVMAVLAGWTLRWISPPGTPPPAGP